MPGVCEARRKFSLTAKRDILGKKIPIYYNIVPVFSSIKYQKLILDLLSH